MTGAAIGTIAPLVKADGNDLPAAVIDAMIGLRISTGLRLPSRAVLEFLDDGFTISAGSTFQLGTAVSVSTALGTELFSGEVTGVELQVEHGAPNLLVTVDDKSYKMTLGNKVRTFTNVTYSDVISQIAGEYGLSCSVTATSQTYEYLLQSDSDFGFVTEIADRVGYDWWVDPTGTFQFHPAGADAGDAPTVGWETGDLRSFSVRASALHPGAITVRGWDPAQKLAMQEQGSSPTGTPTASLVTPFVQASSLTSHSAAQSAYHMFAKQGDGKGLAASATSRWASGAVVATGVCGINAAIAVGKRVGVTDVGPASGSYPVTEVEHSYTARGFETRFTAGEREPTSLVDTLVGGAPSSFRQEALVIGVVTNLGDSSSPQGYVKVKFPSLGDQVESSWARVVSMGAGKSRGMTFLPEVNDEVIVGFEGGDITRPLVLGGLYSGVDTALDYGAANGTIAKRQIVSRLGHVIELGDGDAPADQHIWLTLAGGEFYLKLGKDGLTAAVPAQQPVTIQSGNSSIKIDDTGNIAMSGQKITITAEQDVEISGLDVKLKANVNLEGSAGAELKMSGSAQAEFSSGAMTSVKGAMVAIN